MSTTEKSIRLQGFCIPEKMSSYSSNGNLVPTHFLALYETDHGWWNEQMKNNVSNKTNLSCTHTLSLLAAKLKDKIYKI